MWTWYRGYSVADTRRRLWWLWFSSSLYFIPSLDFSNPHAGCLPLDPWDYVLFSVSLKAWAPWFKLNVSESVPLETLKRKMIKHWGSGRTVHMKFLRSLLRWLSSVPFRGIKNYASGPQNKWNFRSSPTHLVKMCLGFAHPFYSDSV